MLAHALEPEHQPAMVTFPAWIKFHGHCHLTIFKSLPETMRCGLLV